MATTLEKLLEKYESEEAKAYIRHAFEESPNQKQILEGRMGLPSETDAKQGYKDLRDRLGEANISDLMGAK